MHTLFNKCPNTFVEDCMSVCPFFSLSPIVRLIVF